MGLKIGYCSSRNHRIALARVSDSIEPCILISSVAMLLISLDEAVKVI